MICKLCEQEKKLIKAHIIPESFFKPLKSGKRSPEIHTNTEGVFPKKSPIGIYDKSILCKTCDSKLGTWDNYAQDLLLNKISENNAIYDKGEKIGYLVPDYDYSKLKLFFISLLWRASISSHIFFNRVNTGPFETKLKKLILTNDPGDEEDFAITFAKFDNPSFNGMLDPHLDKYDNINYYRFYLTGYIIYIKVDKRRSAPGIENIKMIKGHPLFIILRHIHNSADGKIIKNIINNIKT